MNHRRTLSIAFAASIAPCFIGHAVSAATVTGSISGTIDLTTGKTPARIPATATIRVIVLVAGDHPIAASSEKLIAGPETSIAYRLDGLDAGNKHYLVTVTASPPFDEVAGPGFWSVQFVPNGTKPRIGAMAVSLNAQHPNATAVNFTARGAKLPPAMPLPPPGIPTGYVTGTIALDAAGVSYPAHTALELKAMRSDGSAANVVGSAQLGAIAKDANGFRVVPFSITGLPLNMPLTISVGTTPAPGASPLPTGFAHILRFRVQGQDAGGDSAVITITASAKGMHVNFEPYELEVFPLPQGTPNPPPTQR